MIPPLPFAYSAAQSKAVITLSYTYESRRDQVPAAETAKYLDNIESMRDHLTYQISIPQHWLGSGAAVGLADSGGSGDAFAAKGWAAWLWVALTAGIAVAIYSWKRSMSRPAMATGTPALHRCAVCGETEESNPSLEFRVAVDGLDYCQRHLPARPSGAK